MRTRIQKNKQRIQTKIISARLVPDIHEGIDAWARKHRETRSDVLRRVIEFGWPVFLQKKGKAA